MVATPHELYSDKSPDTLPIRTVQEVMDEAGDGADWIIEDVLARGALTEFSGLAKKGGKTTFWCHAIAASARGEDHAGFATESAKYLYLTEQGNNFAEALRDSGLTEYPEYIHIVQYKDVHTIGWARLLDAAGRDAKRLGLDAIVIDTFTAFARLRGAEENDSGTIRELMSAARLLAQAYNMGIVVIRHFGKDNKPRGSSAFEGEADICAEISRPEGRHAPTVRHLKGAGRYGTWERNIQLSEGRYVSLGTDNKVEFTKAVGFLSSVLPEIPEDGMKKQTILDKREGADREISARTIDRALEFLVKEGDVGKRQLVNMRGKPKIFWLAHKPPGDPTRVSINPQHTHTGFGENKPNEAGANTFIYSRQTSTTTKSSGNKPPSEDYRHVGGEPASASKAAKEGKGDGAPQPDTLSLSAKTATEQGEPVNDACRDDDANTFRTEEEVFVEFRRLMAKREVAA